MPRGYRSVVLAAVGWLILTAANSDPKDQQQQDAAANQAETAALPVQIAPNTSKSQNANQTCVGTSRPDLPCETVSAIASDRQATAAEHGVCIAIAGAFIGFFTLLAAGTAAWFAAKAAIHTGEQADEARTANQNAATANSIAQQALLREVRPWLAIENLRIHNMWAVQAPEGDGLWLCITGAYEIRNFGPSPALFAHYWERAFQIANTEADQTAVASFFEGDHVGGVAVPPHGSFPQEFAVNIGVPREEWAAPRLICMVRYKDAEGHDWHRTVQRFDIFERQSKDVTIPKAIDPLKLVIEGRGGRRPLPIELLIIPARSAEMT